MSNLLTSQFSVDVAENFIDRINKDFSLYVVAAKHTPVIGSSGPNLPTPIDSEQQLIDLYDQMIFGKRVTASDARSSIKKRLWTQGTIYDQYDHEDPNLFDKPFYVAVADGVDIFHVYKCLFNNQRAPSTFEPSIIDPSPFETADGYLWKYMYTIDEINHRKFSTSLFFPVVANSAVQQAAVSRSIEVIEIVDGGRGYDNYLTGVFAGSDLRVNGPNNYLLTSAANPTNDFYRNCILLMTSGPASGQFRTIVGYNVSGGIRTAVLDTPFDTPPAAGDSYQISPAVLVFGVQSSNCIARAIINPSAGNTVSKVEVLSSGSGYRRATAEILAANSVPVSIEASFRPIISPAQGHGANPTQELDARNITISASFANNENGRISVENDFSTVALIKDPLFTSTDVVLNISNTVGNFLVGETLSQYQETLLPGTCSIQSGNTTITGSNTSFTQGLATGDQVLITVSGINVLSFVDSVANNTSLTISSQSTVTSSGALITKIDATRVGRITATATGTLSLSDISSKGLTNDVKLIGQTSGATSAIQSLTINGVNLPDLSSFSIINQLTRIQGQLDSPSPFIEDELVLEQSVLVQMQPKGRVHSFISGSPDTLILSEVENIFTGTGTLIGQQSGAVFNSNDTVINKGDLVHDSGRVFYIENVDPISRAASQTETIKLTLSF
jgi:hypothetical protein